MRPKKDVYLPFSEQTKISENKGQFFVLFCFVVFDSHFVFLNKNVEIKYQNI